MNLQMLMMSRIRFLEERIRVLEEENEKMRDLLQKYLQFFETFLTGISLDKK